MRKGFTLIEVAIAIVIAGIILTAAVKGKSLVGSAKVKSDINKIRRLELATLSYQALTGKLPPVRHTPGNRVDEDIDVDYMITNNYFNTKDTYISIFDENVHMVYCTVQNTNDTIITYNSAMLKDIVSVVSACIGFNSPKIDGISIGHPVKQLCEFEKYTDDKDFFTGSGRYMFNSKDKTKYSHAEMSNCAALPETNAKWLYRMG